MAEVDEGMARDAEQRGGREEGVREAQRSAAAIFLKEIVMRREADIGA
jgi:hypothetical protein